MVQFGPWDYGLSMGLSGAPGTPWSLNEPKIKRGRTENYQDSLKS
jgi:hypothetical protein